MIPEDKFGRPIYSSIFKVLLENSKILEQCGFSESMNKPNLVPVNKPNLVPVNQSGILHSAPLNNTPQYYIQNHRYSYGNMPRRY